jgi:hypothetical protein
MPFEPQRLDPLGELVRAIFPQNMDDLNSNTAYKISIAALSGEFYRPIGNGKLMAGKRCNA